MMQPGTIMLVAGAHLNFVKAALLLWELQKHPQRFRTRLTHEGQDDDIDILKVSGH